MSPTANLVMTPTASPVMTPAQSLAGGNDADTYGWDTVRALNFTHVSKAIVDGWANVNAGAKTLSQAASDDAPYHIERGLRALIASVMVNDPCGVPKARTSAAIHFYGEDDVLARRPLPPVARRA